MIIHYIIRETHDIILRKLISPLWHLFSESRRRSGPKSTPNPKFLSSFFLLNLYQKFVSVRFRKAR